MADSPSAKIVRFPVNRVGVGSVYCPPLKLHFPPLFHVVQTISLEEARRYGEDSTTRFVHYTILEDDNYAGTIVRQPVNRVLEADQASILIRHHVSVEHAMSYLDGVMDMGADDNDPICRTKEGVFTAIRRQTKSAWPGPMVIYAAVHAADNFGGSIVWQLAVGPDGKTAEGDYL